jgi:hypothetical protein
METCQKNGFKLGMLIDEHVITVTSYNDVHLKTEGIKRIHYIDIVDV